MSKKKEPSGRELFAQYVGRPALLLILDRPEKHAAGFEPGMFVPVTIVDFKMNFTGDHVLVTPHMGRGRCWVKVGKVKVVDAWPEKPGPVGPLGESDV